MMAAVFYDSIPVRKGPFRFQLRRLGKDELRWNRVPEIGPLS